MTSIISCYIFWLHRHFNFRFWCPFFVSIFDACSLVKKCSMQRQDCSVSNILKSKSDLTFWYYWEWISNKHLFIAYCFISICIHNYIFNKETYSWTWVNIFANILFGRYWKRLADYILKYHLFYKLSILKTPMVVVMMISIKIFDWEYNYIK